MPWSADLLLELVQHSLFQVGAKDMAGNETTCSTNSVKMAKHSIEAGSEIDDDHR